MTTPAGAWVEVPIIAPPLSRIAAAPGVSRATAKTRLDRLVQSGAPSLPDLDRVLGTIRTVAGVLDTETNNLLSTL